MSPVAVMQIVDASLDAAVSGLVDPQTRLDAVLPIVVRTAARAGAILREQHPELTRAQAVREVLDNIASPLREHVP